MTVILPYDDYVYHLGPGLKAEREPAETEPAWAAHRGDAFYSLQASTPG